MKKFSYILLILVLASTFIWSEGTSESTEKEEGPFRIAVIMPSATTDTAFSQSMWSALVSVQEELGGKDAVELVYSENMFKVPDASAAIRDYAMQGYNLIVAHGSQYGTLVEEIAPDFTETAFAWGTDVNTFGLDNVYAYTASAEQGGYVNGVMAGLLTKSGTIGVTGPIDVGDAHTYVSGFVQGVKSVNSKASVSQTWTGSFSDVALMAAAAQTPYCCWSRYPYRIFPIGCGIHRCCGKSGRRLLVWYSGRSDISFPQARCRQPGIRLDRHA
jgi:basic membrane protein A